MIHPLKIANTLADETRYSIYEFIIQTKRTFSVQQIADHFNIHPNVARLHLTKLTEVQLIEAAYEKTGKGGRPGRIYKFAPKPVSLTYPKQETTQLINWALTIIQRLGDEGLKIAKEVTYEDGFKSMQLLLRKNFPKTMEQKINLLATQSSLIGYVPNVEETINGEFSIQFTIFNCPYGEQYENNPIVCVMHEAYLRGQMDALFGPNFFQQEHRMSSKCEFCKYKITTLQSFEI